MKIDRKALYEAVEEKFPDPAHATEANNLARDCIKLSEGWLEQTKNTGRLTKRELRKDLKAHIMESVDLQDYKKAYFVPSFIWIFIAGQIISFIVRWIIDNYTKGRGK